MNLKFSFVHFKPKSLYNLDVKFSISRWLKDRILKKDRQKGNFPAVSKTRQKYRIINLWPVHIVKSALLWSTRERELFQRDGSINILPARDRSLDFRGWMSPCGVLYINDRSTPHTAFIQWNPANNAVHRFRWLNRGSLISQHSETNVHCKAPGTSSAIFFAVRIWRTLFRVTDNEL